jgi:UDP-N-acetylglucosamine/UDP-N-acetylgalactosamine 4-epimerase
MIDHGSNTALPPGTTGPWVVTGVAGFIGSHLLEHLLRHDQTVIGVDNFATGRPANLQDVRCNVSESKWAQFTFMEADVRDLSACRAACRGAKFVLHQAALGSVPRSLCDPVATSETNIMGCINMLSAARDGGVERFIYAGSSSTYGDDRELPKVESRVGRPLSPYAATKAINETCAEVFARCYGMKTIGLRYFNVFGGRQSPEGPYAAVIPRWIAAMLESEPVIVYGDGETTRDFCPVENVVQANMRAASVEREDAMNQVYNIALGRSTSLNELYEMMREKVERRLGSPVPDRRTYEDYRPGDVRHSRADTTKAAKLLGYSPTVDIGRGLDLALDWHMACAVNSEQ